MSFQNSRLASLSRAVVVGLGLLSLFFILDNLTFFKKGRNRVAQVMDSGTPIFIVSDKTNSTVYDASTLKKRSVVTAVGPILDLALLSGAPCAVVANTERGAVIESVLNGKRKIRLPRCHQFKLRGAVFDTENDALITIGADLEPNEFGYGPGYLKKWDLKTGEGTSLVTLSGSPAAIARSRSGNRIGVGCREGRIQTLVRYQQTWDEAAEFQLGQMPRGTLLDGISISETGKWIAAFGPDETFLWRVNSPGVPVMTERYSGVDFNSVLGLCFCDDRFLIIAESSLVRIYDLDGDLRTSQQVLLPRIGFAQVGLSPYASNNTVRLFKFGNDEVAFMSINVPTGEFHRIAL